MIGTRDQPDSVDYFEHLLLVKVKLQMRYGIAPGSYSPEIGVV